MEIEQSLIYGYVYVLLEPDNKYIFYIGVTTNKINRRLGSHINDSKNFTNKNIRKEDKIREILFLGKKPLIEILDYGISKEHLDELEIRYIKFCKENGINITNESGGGEYIPILDPNKRETIIQKIKDGKKSSFERKIKSLGFSSVEEYTCYNRKKYVSKWLETQPEDYQATMVLESRKRKREELGDEEYRKLVAKKRRDWHASLTEEQKEIQRKKDSIYRKARRERRENNINEVKNI